MAYPSAPALVRVVEDLLGELEQVHDWIQDLKADLARSDEKRARLAQALDSALGTLDPGQRPDYEARMRRLLGDMGAAQAGRPGGEAHEAVLQMLAEWDDDIITTAEVRRHLERKRVLTSRTYAANLLRRLARRGFVLPLSYGRYRVTRQHPHLVARRHGLWEQMQARRARDAAVMDRWRREGGSDAPAAEERGMF